MSILTAPRATPQPTAAPALRIGPLELDVPVVLAPMAGITNTAFRRLCREYGAGLYVSEMITSRALDDLAEQVELPGQRRSPALAGDLRHRAAEVEVDVVGAILGDEHRDRLAHRLRVDPVELDAAGRLRLVVTDEAHALGRPLDERAARDHLGDVEAGAVLAAQAPESRVRDARHRREHDRNVEFERPDLQGGRGRGENGHPFNCPRKAGAAWSNTWPQVENA